MVKKKRKKKPLINKDIDNLIQKGVCLTNYWIKEKIYGGCQDNQQSDEDA